MATPRLIPFGEMEEAWRYMSRISQQRKGGGWKK
jgi:hypothetical protein